MCDVGVIETNGSLTEPDKIDETVDNFLWRVEGGESMAITPPQQHASAAYILQNYIIYATEQSANCILSHTTHGCYENASHTSNKKCLLCHTRHHRSG